MKNFNSVFSTAICATALLVCGCVHTLDGHTHSGVAFTDNTWHSRYERTVDQVVAASRSVLLSKGKLSVDNSVNHTLVAKINERDVIVKVTKVDEKTTALDIQALTGMSRDANLEGELDKLIAIALVNP